MHSDSSNSHGDAEDSCLLEMACCSQKGWIAKRSRNVSSLSIVPPPEDVQQLFNLSDSGSFRDGLLHISERGCAISAPSEPSSTPQFPLYAGATPESTARSTTSAKRANRSDEVRYELHHTDFCLMEVIGKGSSGYVRKALRKSTNEVLALKVINVFEIEKRRQVTAHRPPQMHVEQAIFDISLSLSHTHNPSFSLFLSLSRFLTTAHALHSLTPSFLFFNIQGGCTRRCVEMIQGGCTRNDPRRVYMTLFVEMITRVRACACACMSR